MILNLFVFIINVFKGLFSNIVMVSRVDEFENKIKISHNNMTKIIQKNIKFLEGFLTNSKADVKRNISNIIELFKNSSISNLTTAENMILKLRTVNQSTKNKILNQYEKLINKYSKNEPLNVRIKNTKEKKVLVKKSNAASKIQKLFKRLLNSKYSTTYLIDVLLFTNGSPL